MGRHYPDVHADPVRTHGYYYSKRARKLARLKEGDKLPRHMGPWEFLATDDEGSTSEILQRLRDKYPDLDPYKLTYTTSTPVDPRHLISSRRNRKAGYLLAFLLAAGLSWFLARSYPTPGKRG